MFSDFNFLPLRDRLAIFAILAALLGGIGYVYSSYGRAPASAEANDASAIYVGLPADAALANAQFGERVQSKFPLQTPEDELVRTLSGQGFRADGWFGKRMTFRRLAGGGGGRIGGCDFTASVTWESDDQSRIRTVGARFLRTPGCVDGLTR